MTEVLRSGATPTARARTRVTLPTPRGSSRMPTDAACPASTGTANPSELPRSRVPPSTHQYARTSTPTATSTQRALRSRATVDAVLRQHHPGQRLGGDEGVG